MAILLLFWAILKRGDLMTTQMFTTVAVVFVLMDLAFRLGILAIRTLTAKQNIDKEWNLRTDQDHEGSVRETEVERLDSEQNYNPNLNSSGLVSDRSNPYSTQRIVRPVQPHYTTNVSPIVIRSSIPNSPGRVINQYNPGVGYSGGKFPSNGSRVY